MKQIILISALVFSFGLVANGQSKSYTPISAFDVSTLPSKQSADHLTYYNKATLHCVRTGAASTAVIRVLGGNVSGYYADTLATLSMAAASNNDTCTSELDIRHSHFKVDVVVADTSTATGTLNCYWFNYKD